MNVPYLAENIHSPVDASIIASYSSGIYTKSMLNVENPTGINSENGSAARQKSAPLVFAAKYCHPFKASATAIL